MGESGPERPTTPPKDPAMTTMLECLEQHTPEQQLHTMLKRLEQHTPEQQLSVHDAYAIEEAIALLDDVVRRHCADLHGQILAQVSLARNGLRNVARYLHLNEHTG